MKEFKVGIIGCGGIAQNAHIPGFQRLENVKVVACCDVVESVAKSVAEKFSIPRYYTDYAKMLKSEKLDAVSVCTPNALHKEPTIMALEQGAHVLVEKPIATSAEDGAAMVRAARRAGRILIVGFQERFNPYALLIKRFVDSGDLGWIHYNRAVYLRRRGVPTWGVFLDKKIQGGGALIDIGVHALDLAMYLQGFKKPVSVLGRAYTLLGRDKEAAKANIWEPWDTEKFEVDDNAFAVVTLEDGSFLVLETAWASHVKSTGTSNIYLRGTRGGAQLDPPEIYMDRNGVALDMTPMSRSKPDWREQSYIKMQKFIESIIAEKPLYAPGEEGVVVQSIIDTIYRSTETGRLEPVRIPL
ncbi:MAG: Gfo/Idh/MocA family oxidoreductase [Aigarchaeota archaeon]|nr:Gfo/Idh/MocA family oxidoreductase [Candidatus Calditenuaceae archaeon]